MEYYKQRSVLRSFSLSQQVGDNPTMSSFAMFWIIMSQRCRCAPTDMVLHFNIVRIFYITSTLTDIGKSNYSVDLTIYDNVVDHCVLIVCVSGLLQVIVQTLL